MYVNPNLNSSHPPFPSLCVHMPVLYVYVCSPALETGSSEPFFKIPHIYVNMILAFLFLTYFILYDRL